MSDQNIPKGWKEHNGSWYAPGIDPMEEVQIGYPDTNNPSVALASEMPVDLLRLKHNSTMVKVKNRKEIP